MSIDPTYRPKAAVAADALRAALIAVEDCGADVELTNIVIHLSDDRTKLCNLFGLDPVQAFQADTLALAALHPTMCRVCRQGRCVLGCLGLWEPCECPNCTAHTGRSQDSGSAVSTAREAAQMTPRGDNTKGRLPTFQPACLGCGRSWGSIEAGHGHDDACPVMGPPPPEADWGWVQSQQADQPHPGRVDRPASA